MIPTTAPENAPRSQAESGEALHRTRTDDPFLTMEGEQPTTTRTIAEPAGHNTPAGTAAQPPATQARSPHVPQHEHGWDPEPLRLAVALTRLCESGDRLLGRPSPGARRAYTDSLRLLEEAEALGVPTETLDAIIAEGATP